MVTGLEKFKKEMQGAKELYSNEISDFTKKFDALGGMTILEEPDIDTQEYIFAFEKVNGTSDDELEKIHLEIHNHMDEFSKIHGIEKFCQFSRIWL